MARRYHSRFECGHEGCREVGNYESHTRAEQTDLHKRHGNKQWRCVRHSQPDEVLGTKNPVVVAELVSGEIISKSGGSLGLYWKRSSVSDHGRGFVFGEGFKAFAKDFPEGTVLRVTAEIILPETPDGTV